MSVTSTSLKLKFPEFKDEDPATIEFAIEEASRNVDDTWSVKDVDLGVYYYAAHLLMVSISRRESASGQQVASERFGEMSITYKTPEQPTQANPSDLTTTIYGARFLELATLNFPAVAII
jgi:hypothetical protein